MSDLLAKPTVFFVPGVGKSSIERIMTVIPKLSGNVAVKVHSGEKGNLNFLRPDYVKPLIDLVNGTVVECNTAYAGARNTTKEHMKLMREHGWSSMKFDIMDSDEPDLILESENYIEINKDYVGNHMQRYDSMLVISHFKGHPMGGYGGALKQLSIGCASSYGKMYIHGAGDPRRMWTCDQKKFLGAMADAANMVHNYFKDRGGIFYINIMKNISVDCDCIVDPEPPCMEDIGILASSDPVAVDWACLDKITSSNDPGREKLLDRIRQKEGFYTPKAANRLGLGLLDYELVQL